MHPVCGAVGTILLANEVEDVAKRRAILLSVSGNKTYVLARDFLQPGPGCQGLSWRQLVQCQHEFNLTTGRSSGGNETMLDALRMMQWRRQLQV